jgi:hypothetical protein
MASQLTVFLMALTIVGFASVMFLQHWRITNLNEGNKGLKERNTVLENQHLTDSQLMSEYRNVIESLTRNADSVVTHAQPEQLGQVSKRIAGLETAPSKKELSPAEVLANVRGEGERS